MKTPENFQPLNFHGNKFSLWQYFVETNGSDIMIWSFVMNIFCSLTDFIQCGVHQNKILVLKTLENEYCVGIVHNFAV